MLSADFKNQLALAHARALTKRAHTTGQGDGGSGQANVRPELKPHITTNASESVQCPALTNSEVKPSNLTRSQFKLPGSPPGVAPQSKLSSKQGQRFPGLPPGQAPGINGNRLGAATRSNNKECSRSVAAYRFPGKPPGPCPDSVLQHRTKKSRDKTPVAAAAVDVTAICMGPAPPPGAHARKLQWQSIPVAKAAGSMWVALAQEEFSACDLSLSGDLSSNHTEVSSLSSNAASVTRLDLDYKKLTELFFDLTPHDGVSKCDTSSSGSDVRRPSVTQGGSTTITVLDPKRRQNVEICLKAPLDTGSPKPTLTPESLQVVLNLYPTPEEERSILAAEKRVQCEPGCILGKAEQFMKALLGIEGLREKIESYIIRHSFAEEVDALSVKLRRLKHCLTAVLTSLQRGAFRALLGLILRVGNYLNYGSRRGAAVGFTMDSLAQLRSVKSIDGSTTLLRIIADSVDQQTVNATRLWDDLRSSLGGCHCAVDCSLDDASAVMKQLVTKLRKVETTARLVHDEAFTEVFSQFTKTAQGQLAAVQEELRSVEEQLLQLSSLLAEKTKNPNDGIDVLRRLDRFWKELCAARTENVEKRLREQGLKTSRRTCGGMLTTRTRGTIGAVPETPNSARSLSQLSTFVVHPEPLDDISNLRKGKLCPVTHHDAVLPIDGRRRRTTCIAPQAERVPLPVPVERITIRKTVDDKMISGTPSKSLLTTQSTTATLSSPINDAQSLSASDDSTEPISSSESESPQKSDAPVKSLPRRSVASQVSCSSTTSNDSSNCAMQSKVAVTTTSRAPAAWRDVLSKTPKRTQAAQRVSGPQTTASKHLDASACPPANSTKPPKVPPLDIERLKTPWESVNSQASLAGDQVNRRSTTPPVSTTKAACPPLLHATQPKTPPQPATHGKETDANSQKPCHRTAPVEPPPHDTSLRNSSVTPSSNAPTAHSCQAPSRPTIVEPCPSVSSMPSSPKRSPTLSPKPKVDNRPAVVCDSQDSPREQIKTTANGSLKEPRSLLLESSPKQLSSDEPQHGTSTKASLLQGNQMFPRRSTFLKASPPDSAQQVGGTPGAKCHSAAYPTVSKRTSLSAMTLPDAAQLVARFTKPSTAATPSPAASKPLDLPKTAAAAFVEGRSRLQSFSKSEQQERRIAQLSHPFFAGTRQRPIQTRRLP